MAIIFTAPKNYVWSNPSPRPAKPNNFALDVLQNFLLTDYAKNTSLFMFLTAHPNAFGNGVLNQLHRRHIIAWDTIKAFMAKAACTDHNQETANTVRPVADWFGIRQPYVAAANTPHGPGRAALFTNLANGICWMSKNVWIGPSAGNVGVNVDLGADLTDLERGDMLKGTPWQGANFIHALMDGFASA